MTGVLAVPDPMAQIGSVLLVWWEHVPAEVRTSCPACPAEVVPACAQAVECRFGLPLRVIAIVKLGSTV